MSHIFFIVRQYSIKWSESHIKYEKNHSFSSSERNFFFVIRQDEVKTHKKLFIWLLSIDLHRIHYVMRKWTSYITFREFLIEWKAIFVYCFALYLILFEFFPIDSSHESFLMIFYRNFLSATFTRIFCLFSNASFTFLSFAHAHE